MKQIKKFFELIIIVTTFVLLISLGIWQLFRLQEKNLYLSKIKYGIENQAIDINSLKKIPYYTKIKLKGSYLPNLNIYLYAANKEKKDAYYLISPFKTDTGKIILVANGVFEKKYQEKLTDIFDDQYQEIVGITLKSEQKNIFIPNNDFIKNIWFTLNIKEASDFLKLQLEDFYVIKMSTHIVNEIGNYDTSKKVHKFKSNDYNNQYLLPIDSNKLINISNNHLEYALTWFGLAIALVFMYI